jgi:hypothetical protein
VFLWVYVISTVFCIAAPGTYCPVGSENENNCSAGTFNSLPGQLRCHACAKGYYQQFAGATACSACVPGHWCSTDTQIRCSENTWNPYSLSNQVTDCTRCPERTSTLGQSGVTSIEACFCEPGFFLAPVQGFDTSTIKGCKDRCCVCPIGTDCSAGAIHLARLPLKQGYFRLSANDVDVRTKHQVFEPTRWRAQKYAPLSRDGIAS